MEKKENVGTRFWFHVTKDNATGELGGCLMRIEEPDLENEVVEAVAVTFETDPRGREQAEAFEGAIAFGGEVGSEILDRIFTLGLQAGLSLRKEEGN